MKQKRPLSNNAVAKKIAAAFEREAQKFQGDEEMLTTIRLAGSVHTALATRGWSRFAYDDPTDLNVYSSVWLKAEPTPDHINQIYYETTSISITDNNAILVEFACLSDGPFSAASYLTLDQLLADISSIETFRYGDSIPNLPNAEKVLSDMPNLHAFYRN